MITAIILVGMLTAIAAGIIHSHYLDKKAKSQRQRHRQGQSMTTITYKYEVAQKDGKWLAHEYAALTGVIHDAWCIDLNGSKWPVFRPVYFDTAAEAEQAIKARIEKRQREVDKQAAEKAKSYHVPPFKHI